MLRPLRSLVALAILAGGLWAAFAVDLGGRTFAEHVDTISETAEAEQLIEGTRATINPALQELRDRVLGEYVEAPTWIPDRPAVADDAPPEPTIPASTLPLDDGATAEVFEPPLPGRAAAPELFEPPLPGANR